MRLEPPLYVAERKLTQYLLIPRDKNDKSIYLGLGGYTIGNWQLLQRDLLILASSQEATFEGEDDYGPSYLIIRALTGPNGRVLRVKTIWKHDVEEEITKFITLHPSKQ